MIAVFVLSAVMSGAAFQTGGRAANAPAPGACTLLTKEILMAHSPASKDAFALFIKLPPEEEKAGGGTACQYGDTNLQINPFLVASVEKLFDKWTPVTGVGERAWFRDNQGMWAELAVVASGRTLTIQMDVPKGRTAASIQSNTISMAKAILAKLK
jgi:hypothetical protein